MNNRPYIVQLFSSLRIIYHVRLETTQRHSLSAVSAQSLNINNGKRACRTGKMAALFH